MIATIEFFKTIEENSLPTIFLTKSKNGQTGTATFLFLNPTSLKRVRIELFPIQNLSLNWEESCKKKKIITKYLNLIFKKGKPRLVKAIFIFKNAKEWFDFFSFMRYYCQQTGLSFSEKDSAS